LSSFRRRLQKEDLSVGLSFCSPEHVLIAIEFAGFAGNANEEALPFTGVMANGRARISYRFRPKQSIREEHEETLFDQLPTNLTLNDYVWEMTAGADNVDLNAVGWKDNYGTRFHTEILTARIPLIFYGGVAQCRSESGGI